MTTQHTPTPWHVWSQGLETKVRSGVDLNIASTHGISSKDNAAFIVRACNAHDELVAALRVCADRLEEMANGKELFAVENARAALAKVAK